MLDCGVIILSTLFQAIPQSVKGRRKNKNGLCIRYARTDLGSALPVNFENHITPAGKLAIECAGVCAIVMPEHFCVLEKSLLTNQSQKLLPIDEVILFAVGLAGPRVAGSMWKGE